MLVNTLLVAFIITYASNMGEIGHPPPLNIPLNLPGNESSDTTKSNFKFSSPSLSEVSPKTRATAAIVTCGRDYGGSRSIRGNFV